LSAQIDTESWALNAAPNHHKGDHRLMSLKPAIFLDRDDTLIRDDGYIYEIEKFAWISGAAEALKRFHQAGLPVFIVTN